MLDNRDLEILTIMQKDARVSNAELARRLGMAPSGILERVRKLEARGVIQSYEMRIDPAAVDRDLLAFVFVRAEESPGEMVTGDRLAEIPEVLEVHHVAGEDCYLVKVRVAGTGSLGDLLRHRFGAIPSVRSTRSTIVLDSVKETMALPLRPPKETEELEKAS
ncbi:MAG: Lrp/AsnC family transcriptional regulator [Acidobacteriota bacterium]|nr:Lrp/AsnC family transcriptional regulator [Acidobacteriota bacterium]